MAARREPDYERLHEFRKALREFLRWSDEVAQAQGLTAAQHQLLLTIRGRDQPPTIGEVADDLLLRHHSAGELINRAEAAGLVRREVDPDDRRQVRVSITRVGERILGQLTQQHLAEIRRLAPIIDAIADD